MCSFFPIRKFAIHQRRVRWFPCDGMMADAIEGFGDIQVNGFGLSEMLQVSPLSMRHIPEQIGFVKNYVVILKVYEQFERYVPP